MFYFQANSSIVLRLFSVISGNDPSFNYRFLNGNNIMKAILEEVNMIGLGFRSLNTEYTAALYHSFGLIRKKEKYVFY